MTVAPRCPQCVAWTGGGGRKSPWRRCVTPAPLRSRASVQEAAGVILAVLRDVGSRRELVTAIAVAGRAAVGGLWRLDGRKRGRMGLAQLPLVAVILSAGWRIAQRVGCADAGIGPATSVEHGLRRGIRDAAFGLALAVPWALGNFTDGLFTEDAIGLGLAGDRRTTSGRRRGPPGGRGPGYLLVRLPAYVPAIRSRSY
jgi:hypothetical protein